MQLSKIKDRINLAALHGTKSVLALLGFSGMRRLGNALGNLAWLFLKKRRQLAVSNIVRHLGTTEEEARKLAKSSFRHSLRSFLEILLTNKFDLSQRGKRLRIADPVLWEQFLACERPVVAVTGHFGAWEFLASLLGHVYEEPRPRMVVVRRYPNKAVQQFITEQRQAKGATMVGHRTVASSVLRALRKNGIVAFLVDHKPLRSEAIQVPFLGENTYINMGPALLAVRAEATIWPVFLAREGKGYVFHLGEPLDTRQVQGSRDEKIETVTRFYSQAVEKMILLYPDQWFWMHNRWKPYGK